MLPRLCSLRRYSAHGHAPLNSKITAARRWTWRTRCLGGLVDKILFNFSSLWVKTIPLLFSGSGRWTDRSCHTFFQTAPICGQALSVDEQAEGDHGLPMECQRASTRDHDWTIIYPRLFQTNGGQIMFGNKRGRVSSSHLSRTITKLSPCTGRSTSVRTPGALHCHFTHRWQIWLSTKNTRPRHFLFIF